LSKKHSEITDLSAVMPSRGHLTNENVDLNSQ